ncbi:hypothetical protein Prum_035900 [Phytohabitans rumicis]|uniref:Uncharacterized protein n=1 Tax=Phytohabitans rumicis TaxID=1076125 RepID=A0A6V8L4P1_9ACTN|nr:hypothetical protein Prum_035900 [Phytohabitans rumicis]
MQAPMREDPRGLSEQDGNLSQPPCPALTEGNEVRVGGSLKTDPERDHSTAGRTAPNPTATSRHNQQSAGYARGNSAAVPARHRYGTRSRRTSAASALPPTAATVP